MLELRPDQPRSLPAAWPVACWLVPLATLALQLATFARERRAPRREPAEAGFVGRDRGARGGAGFTGTLDPDVARVFRGDASVNKALRLVMQLMQVVQGPPRSFGPRAAGRPEGERPRRAYQGRAEARGFTRKPRFEDDEQ